MFPDTWVTKKHDLALLKYLSNSGIYNLLKIGTEVPSQISETSVEGFEDLDKNILQTIGGSNLYKRIESIC